MSATTGPDYFAGLDLGQVHDPTALAVLQRTADPSGCRYGVRWLERFPLGTPYPAVVERVRGAFAPGGPLERAVLAVDHTGVGRPVVDLLKAAKLKARLVPVTITAGSNAEPDPAGGWRVPKLHLVSTLQVLLQTRRLLVSRQLAEAQELLRELADFRVRLTAAANEVFAAREGANDDLVLAVACAAWAGEKLFRGPVPPPRAVPVVYPYDLPPC